VKIEDKKAKRLISALNAKFTIEKSAAPT
jgi:hypothetical protein